MNHLLLPMLLTLGQSTAHRYRPFIDPVSLKFPGLHDVWWLTLLPIAFFVSMAYKGVRLHDLSRYPRQVAMMTTQIILAMIGLAVGLFVLIEVVVPWLDR